MKFRIIGANRDTGEDVKMVISVPDRESAERWATDNEIIWTEIIAQEPPPASQPPLKPIHLQPRTAIQQPAPTRIASFAAPQATVHTASIPANAGVTVLQQTMVMPHKSVSGFGIASLVLGIIAAIFCWIPFVGMLSIPIAAIGFLLGAVGLLVSAIGRKSGVGVPVAGSAICVLAVVVAIASTGGTAKTISDQIKANAQAQQRTNQQVVALNGSTLSTASTAPSESQPQASAAATNPSRNLTDRHRPSVSTRGGVGTCRKGCPTGGR